MLQGVLCSCDCTCRTTAGAGQCVCMPSCRQVDPTRWRRQRQQIVHFKLLACRTNAALGLVCLLHPLMQPHLQAGTHLQLRVINDDHIAGWDLWGKKGVRAWPHCACDISGWQALSDG